MPTEGWGRTRKMEMLEEIVGDLDKIRWKEK